MAFWSITVYGKDGFMKSENCIVNSSNVKLNNDGTCKSPNHSLPVYKGMKLVVDLHIQEEGIR